MEKVSRVTPYITLSHRHGCLHCLQCVNACPKHVLGTIRFFWHNHISILRPDDCIGCGKCVNVCPKGLFDFNKKRKE